MRQNPSFTLASEDGVKRLIREHPWMTIVSMTVPNNASEFGCRTRSAGT